MLQTTPMSVSKFPMLGVAAKDHFVPFHAMTAVLSLYCLSVFDAKLSPTAVHEERDVHDMECKSLSNTVRLGVWEFDHREPFHNSTRFLLGIGTLPGNVE
jgi:hypothetical protein